MEIYRNSRNKALPNLPTELIDQILVRFPVETLHICKFVSHTWYTKISSPSFAKSRNAYFRRYKKIILYENSSIYSVPIYDNYLMNSAEQVTSEKVKGNFHYGFILLTSCNGLLLVYERDKHRLCIWNPSSGELKEVPLPEDGKNIYPAWTSFGCTSSLEENCDNYKVFYTSSSGTKFGWYSIRNNSWGVIRELPYSPGRTSGALVLVNSKFHCFASTHANDTVILAFDIEDEEFKEVPQPGYSVGGSGMYMAELNGNLCVTSKKEGPPGWCFWVLKEYGVKESWTNMFSISYENIRSPFGTCCRASPLHVFEDGKFLLHTWFYGIGNVVDKITFYDARDHESRTLTINGIPDQFWTTTCVETRLTK